MENKKFASFPILNSSIEDLDPEPNLMTLVLFVTLEHLYPLRKNFEKYIPENINNYAWIKNPFTANVADVNGGISFWFSGRVD